MIKGVERSVEDDTSSAALAQSTKVPTTPEELLSNLYRSLVSKSPESK